MSLFDRFILASCIVGLVVLAAGFYHSVTAYPRLRAGTTTVEHVR